MGFTVVFARRNVATATTPVTKPATPRTAASHTWAGRSKSSRAVARATSHINAPARTTITGGGIFDSSDAIRSILCAIDHGCDVSPFKQPRVLRASDQARRRASTGGFRDANAGGCAAGARGRGGCARAAGLACRGRRESHFAPTRLKSDGRKQHRHADPRELFDPTGPIPVR